MSEYIHVIPLNDLREHESNRECWCHPRPDDEEHDVIVHQSLDGRETYETGERLKS